jgi:CheY-like chemotaxis protein
VTKTRGPVVLCIGNDPVHLNLRCAALKEYGWRVISSGSGHEGVIRFGQEVVDAVVIDLNHDGSESALITGELKRIRPEVPVIIIISDDKGLANGALKQASAVIKKSEEANKLIQTLETLLRREP